jgi:sarcosine oxidase, subunit alpha
VTGEAWVAAATKSLGQAGVRVLTATTASVALDQNGMILAQRIGARLPVSKRSGNWGALPEQRLWHVRARAIVLATGATERPIVFQDNDRPGIMLASAARAYLNRYAIAPVRAVVFTCCDDAYRTAIDWRETNQEVTVAAIVDSRESAGELQRRAESLGIRVLRKTVVEGTEGDERGCLQAVRARSPNGTEQIVADLLAISGGFEPSLSLHLQRRGPTRYDEQLAAVVPAGHLPGQWISGAANGQMALGACLADGVRAAHHALASISVASGGWTPPIVTDIVESDPQPIWSVPPADGDSSRCFVDLHRDATLAGIERAVNAGVRHIEHVKRYTLIGTGVEQGRSAKTNAGVLTASLTDQQVASVGTSGSRPPVEPLTFHLLAGRAKGALFEPVRTTSLHALHESLGAVFEPAGQWLRPNHYPRAGETKRDALRRECRAARTGVAIMDASTLGKIDVQGSDATWFLEQLYANPIGSIPVGRAKYSLMCRMDGATTALSCVPAHSATSSLRRPATRQRFSTGWRSGSKPNGPRSAFGPRRSQSSSRRSRLLARAPGPSCRGSHQSCSCRPATFRFWPCEQGP